MAGRVHGLAILVGVNTAQAQRADVIDDGRGAGADAGVAELALMVITVQDSLAAGAVASCRRACAGIVTLKTATGVLG